MGKSILYIYINIVLTCSTCCFIIGWLLYVTAKSLLCIFVSHILLLLHSPISYHWCSVETSKSKLHPTESFNSISF